MNPDAVARTSVGKRSDSQPGFSESFPPKKQTNSRKYTRNQVRSVCPMYSGTRNMAMVSGMISAQRRPKRSDIPPYRAQERNVMMLPQNTGTDACAGVQPSSFVRYVPSIAQTA